MSLYLRICKRLDKVADKAFQPGSKLHHGWHHQAGPKVNEIEKLWFEKPSFRQCFSGHQCGNGQWSLRE